MTFDKANIRLHFENWCCNEIMEFHMKIRHDFSSFEIDFINDSLIYDKMIYRINS